MPGDAGARQFYGGEPLTGNPAPSAGEITAGRYTGPETPAQGPWKCPACSADNQGPIPQGCTSCGAGKPGYHVKTPPSPVLEPPPAPAEAPLIDAVSTFFGTWFRQRFGHDPDPLVHLPLEEAFRMGWIMSQQVQVQRTMVAAPVTVDVATLAPHTKAQRTIIAALEIFKDQILSQAPDEIASGEWMGPGEVDALIAQLRSDA